MGGCDRGGPSSTGRLQALNVMEPAFARGRIAMTGKFWSGLSFGSSRPLDTFPEYEKISQPSGDRASQQQGSKFCDNVPNQAFRKIPRPERDDLRLLGGKDLLGGNSVRAVAHAAPQRQLE
jgi:hypothetical protein